MNDESEPSSRTKRVTDFLRVAKSRVSFTPQAHRPLGQLLRQLFRADCVEGTSDRNLRRRLAPRYPSVRAAYVSANLNLVRSSPRRGIHPARSAESSVLAAG